jgi:probable rRNA maturation factor
VSTSHGVELGLEADEVPASSRQILHAVRSTLRMEHAPPTRIEVAVVGDARIAELNRQYLDTDGPTDVLSFPLSDPDERPLEGLIVVSSDTARRQADRLGHDPAAELILYVIHGCLHLLGYDDREPEAFARMHEREAHILSALGYPPIFQEAAPCE